MKYILWTILSCTLLFETAHSQESNVRFSVHSVYIPQFTVQETSANHLKPLGVRLMISDYDKAPFEIGVNAYAHYGETARVSFGISLAYLLAERNNHDFKVGVNLNKIELEDVLVDDVDAIGPQVGDVRFDGFGNEFKPYFEWEWMGIRFASFSVQMGYRIINGEKSVVTDVEKVYDPELGFPRTVLKERDWSFFYSASGFEIGVGINIPLLRQ